MRDDDKTFEQEILCDLNILISLGLVDAVLDDNNEWRYGPTEKMKSMSMNELRDFLDGKLDE